VQPLETVLAPELQEARKRRRNWLAVAGFMAMGLGVVALEFRALHDWMQGLRSRRMAAKAEAEILGGNIEEAVNKARTAYQTKPDEPAAIRIAARVQGLTGQPFAAVPLWKQLMQTGAMRPADRRPYAEDLLMSGAVAEAGVEIEALLKENPADGTLHRLAARWAASDGDGERARDFAAKAVRLEADSQESRLLLALLQLSAGTAPLRDEAIRTMLELGNAHSREGIEALKRLAAVPGLSPDVAGKVLALIRGHPLATEEHRLLALHLELGLHPEERTTILDATVRQYQKADPAARRALGVWLNARGEYERMLAVVPIEEAFKRKDLLLLCLDSLAGLRRWNEIERILGMKNVPLDTAYKELFLARSALELGSATVADMHWRRARIAAGPSSEQLAYIGNYAEKIGQLDQAEAAFRSLSANGATARPALESLLRIAQKRGDVAMLTDTLKTMRERWPQDDSVKNDLAYVNLLMGRAVDESMAAAKELVARSPASLAHRTTLALAAIRKNDPARALAVYQGLTIPWDRVGPGHRAVYAAALGANGKTAEARAEIAALRWEELRPEERELIKSWRTP
jgi:tetratricopeptide (TPR) repeat protein